LFFIGAALAEGQDRNRQKIYPVDSPVYRAIRALSISQGLALPSTTGPWSEDELIMMLGRIDAGALREGEIDAFCFAEEELGGRRRFFDGRIRVNLEGRSHANTRDFLLPSDYIRLWNLSKNLLDVDLEGRVTNHAYGFLTLSFGAGLFNKPVVRYGPKGSLMAGSSFFGENPFSTSLFFLPPSSLMDTNFNIPSRGFASLGGRGWNVQIGRDRLSWGPGESGNLMVGDHLEYHNTARASFFNRAFKYTFNLSGFPYPDEYYEGIWVNTPLNSPNHDLANVRARPYAADSFDFVKFSGINLFTAHRFEARFFKNKLNIALTEAVMYQDQRGLVDMQVLNPLIILTGLYRPWNFNSMISLEADFTPIRNLNLYASIVVDEIAFSPAEKTPGKSDQANPNALGYLIGAKTAVPLGKGMLAGSLEGVLTDPYLYLRSSGSEEARTSEQRGLNWVVANRYFSADRTAVLFNEDFLGYRWGGDAIVINARAGYEIFGNWSVTGNFMFMAHGTVDKYTVWNKVNVSKPPYNAKTPTSNHPDNGMDGSEDILDNYADPDALMRDAVSYTFALSLSGFWRFYRSFSLYGELDLVWILNPRNIKANPPASDLQCTLGLSYMF
jgi:hypothetical protein